MKRIAIISCIVILGFINIASGATNDVFIDVENSVVGRGTSFLRGSECFVITAYHIVDGPGSIKIIGHGAVHKSAKFERNFFHDIAILRTETSSSICAEVDWPDSAELNKILEEYTGGILKSRTKTGGLQQIPVFLNQIGDDYLRIITKLPNDELTQGLSGSSLFVGNSRVGMLLSVDPRGRGKVLRFDRINNLISSYLPSFQKSERESISGKWKSNFGDVIFDQDDKNVTGTLIYGPGPAQGFTAGLEGIFEDGEYDFIWWINFGTDNRTNPTGKGVLKLSSDGKTLKGTFSDKNNPGGTALMVLTR